MPDAQPSPSPRGSWFAAAATIAATYVYFLIFAEFALLELVRAIAPDRLRIVMAGFGAGGVVGAVLAARSFTVGRQRTLLTWALRTCALAALLAAGAKHWGALAAAALLVGLALGALTVTLTAGLRSATQGRRLGLCVGAGTGLAYALCNLPALFQASPRMQTFVAAGVVAVASFLPRAMRQAAVERAVSGDYAPAGVARWVVVLLALVWMDSAAFYIVQHTPELRASTWGGTTALVTNALVHLGAALAAGALLDRAGHGRVAAVAAAALAVACLVLNGVVPVVIPAAWWYTAGVSLYSTVLVDYPARSGRPGVAALVFAIAGWMGSALGIGMAQDRQGIPVAFVGLAGGTVALALIGRARARRSVAALVAIAAAGGTGRADADEALQVARGRGVYIAEGCLHCHSQFIRPKVALDVEWWGPAVPLANALRASPPLFGNRRQGPDLANVGNRRSAEWNRLHLLEPQAISPGSRMPRYAHLFAPGDGRGEALVTYLASLGADTRAERQAQIAQWAPSADRGTAPAASRFLFLRLCAPCHGDEGRGDGPAAAKLSLRPPDWTQSPWRHVPAGETREVALSRIIKYGLPGLAMAGHEYLPDGDIVGLARLVRTMHKGDGAAVAVSPPMKILIVEDERKVSRFVERALTEQAYTTRMAGSCAEARDALADSPYDAVVLDLGLPDGDGLDLLREWRAAGFNEPVLILSARDAVHDRIRGLNLGADDYLPKPFSVDELIARLRSLLRRQGGVKTTLLEHRGLRMDLLARTVTVGGVPVELTAREFALLELFLLNPGRVLTRTFIAEKIWEASYDMETNLIDVYVRRLRLKCEQPGGEPVIRTVRGSGYQLA